MAQKLRVGYYPIRDNKLALWVAQDAKLFAKHGLEVALRSDARGQTVAEVISKTIDIGVVGFRAAVDALAAGADLVFVASLAANPFIFLARPEIQLPQELKGKKVWTAPSGEGPNVATRLVLAHLGINPDNDVELVPGGDNHANGVQWMLDGKVSASLSNRGKLKDLLKQGKKITLLADFMDSGLAITAADVLVRRDWLEAHRDAAKSFLKAVVEATAYAKTHKDFTDAICEKYLLKDYVTGIETKFEDYVLGVLPEKPYPLTKGLETAIRELAPGDSFVRQKKAEEFIDASIIAEIEKEGFIEQLYRRSPRDDAK
jgi:ABC-type nitrate/sulfonate/bicarbonate transport system substrate-binding protein